MGTEAQTALFKLKQLGEKKLVAEEMLPFYKRPFSVNLSKDYIVLIRETLCTCLAKLQQGKLSVVDQRNTLNLLFLYQANIDSLIACRIELKHIFDMTELNKIKELQDLLD